MKKLIPVLLATACLSLTSCAVEKEYKMTVRSNLIAAKTKINDQDVNLVYCTRTLSAFNYYIVVDADEFDEEAQTMKARKTTKEVKYVIIESGKEKTVSDHGYQFISWGE